MFQPQQLQRVINTIRMNGPDGLTADEIWGNMRQKPESREILERMLNELIDTGKLMRVRGSYVFVDEDTMLGHSSTLTARQERLFTTNNRKPLPEPGKRASRTKAVEAASAPSSGSAVFTYADTDDTSASAPAPAPAPSTPKVRITGESLREGLAQIAPMLDRKPEPTKAAPAPVSKESRPEAPTSTIKDGKLQRTLPGGSIALLFWRERKKATRLCVSDIIKMTGGKYAYASVYAIITKLEKEGYIEQTTGRVGYSQPRYFRWTGKYNYPFKGYRTEDERLLVIFDLTAIPAMRAAEPTKAEDERTSLPDTPVPAIDKADAVSPAIDKGDAVTPTLIEKTPDQPARQPTGDTSMVRTLLSMQLTLLDSQIDVLRAQREKIAGQLSLIAA